MPSATVDLPTLPVLCVQAMKRLDIAVFLSVMMRGPLFAVSTDRKELPLLRTDHHLIGQKEFRAG